MEAWLRQSDRIKLKRLDLRTNEGLSELLPDEVLANYGDPESILAAYRRFKEGKTKSLNEAKLLMVGNEAVGKTSLLRFLIDRKPRDPVEKKTLGIATQEKIETEAWSQVASDISLSVWDFGGQQIMRGTHRFFLTARSLYLLMLEDRREDDLSIPIRAISGQVYAAPARTPSRPPAGYPRIGWSGGGAGWIDLPRKCSS